MLGSVLSRDDIRRALLALAGELQGMSERCETVDLRELVRAILSYDALTARQWVADSMRQAFVWASMPKPTDLDEVEMGVAAGVAGALCVLFALFLVDGGAASCREVATARAARG